MTLLTPIAKPTAGNSGPPSVEVNVSYLPPPPRAELSLNTTSNTVSL